MKHLLISISLLSLTALTACGGGGGGGSGSTAVVASTNSFDVSSGYRRLVSRDDTSYVIEADTATTVILNLITKTFNSSGNVTLTEQDRYRVAADGSLTFISFDLQRSGTSTLRLTGS